MAISNKDKKIFDWMDHYHLFNHPHEHKNFSYETAKFSMWNPAQFIISSAVMKSQLIRTLYGY